MSSDDEDDYMSDKVLQMCGDTRPGLAPKQIQQKYEKEKSMKVANKQNATIPKHKLEATHREAGLSASISTESKGFALLQKMGYKPGMGIGKLGNGRVEPVPIELKTNRSGLGRDSEMKRKATEMNNMRAAMLAKRQKAVEKQKETFVGRMSERFSEKHVERDLRTAQRACLQLDQEQGLTEPEEPFFWPAVTLLTKEEEEKSDDDVDEKNCESESDEDEITECPAYLEFSEAERLEIVTRYLRNVYSYCLWCGTKYDDNKDLEANCPGNSFQAHE
ncbi:G patch domain-containing protein 11-like [Physella acuta]|uniref:G patch domain-containing protein 11-like n=1 Tax=Physella acuta TaxID=109671 RepID=UPI0027DC3E18|nr:G patch domain-containing protein 11-like [Physella acuta]XP_059154919.1 G patch domain-containing protein 11-like [Physella acuta]XP_059154927.1 G patch domain-containing protein 11-like [Physella acuta]XP_059154935.1 G patch domain-containing protein 11-like [Physella acuta]XP_059154943.1 G patch domain-containing protein 11-like [Physella acuta]